MVVALAQIVERAKFTAPWETDFGVEKRERRIVRLERRKVERGRSQVRMLEV